MKRDDVREALKRVPQWENRQGRVTPLSGGITNRNFRVDIDDESYVLRIFSGSTDPLGINRDHEYACTRIASELGIGPEVIHYSAADGVLATRFVDGKTVSPEEARRPEILGRIVASIQRFHTGPEFPGRFSAFRTVRDYHGLALEKGVQFPGTLPRALELMGDIESALARIQREAPCHNDLLAANFLDDGDTVWVIDWEYAAMGDPFFDLGNFAVNQELSGEEARLLLELYGGKCTPADLAHLNLMKLASDLRESFWGFLQGGISTLDFDYSAYGRKHLDRFLSGASTPHFRSWLREVEGDR